MVKDNPALTSLRGTELESNDLITKVSKKPETKLSTKTISEPLMFEEFEPEPVQVKKNVPMNLISRPTEISEELVIEQPPEATTETQVNNEEVIDLTDTAIEAYFELIDIIAVEKSHNQARQETSERVSFTEFSHDLQPEESPKKLTGIQECAPDQPPEVTLLQTMELLEADTFEPTENQELIAVLDDINDLLAEAGQTDEEMQPTPELTEKLIELFGVLGYEDPAQALLDTVRRRGAIFVLEAACDLAKAASKTKHQERLLVSAGGSSPSPSQPTGLRFGKNILALVAQIIMLPVQPKA